METYCSNTIEGFKPVVKTLIPLYHEKLLCSQHPLICLERSISSFSTSLTYWPPSHHNFTTIQQHQKIYNAQQYFHISRLAHNNKLQKRYSKMSQAPDKDLLDELLPPSMVVAIGKIIEFAELAFPPFGLFRLLPYFDCLVFQFFVNCHKGVPTRRDFDATSTRALPNLLTQR